VRGDHIPATENPWLRGVVASVDIMGINYSPFLAASWTQLRPFQPTLGTEAGSCQTDRSSLADDFAGGYVREDFNQDRTGIRLSPYGAFNAMVADVDTDALYTHLASKLSALGLVYLHVVDHSSMGAPPVSAQLKATLRQTFKGAYILSGGYDRPRAEADLVEGRGDLVAFGRPFIANPKLPALLASGAELAQPDFATFYTPGEKGYSDYPVVG
jgi:hypothetical protein